MGGKGSKTSVGSLANSVSASTLTHHRAASLPVSPSHSATSLSPRKAGAVETKLHLLDQIYSGIAASVLLSKSGDLIYARGLDVDSRAELRKLFPRFVTCLSGFERSLEDSDVRYMHIYGALRCFSCFRIDDKAYLVFFTAPSDVTPRNTTTPAVRSVLQHSSAQDERVKQLCLELRPFVEPK